MAKTYLGVDIGHDRLKLALVKGNRVKKTAIAEMPEKLLVGGAITSVEALGELIRSTMRTAHIRSRDAAVILSGENVFARNVVMPQMTAKQLEYNLPFEFRDYISGELKGFTFDYAVLSTERAEQTPEKPAAEGEAVQNKSMELLAVAAPTEQLEQLRLAMRKAGMKMAMAAPAICSYGALLALQKNEEQETCVLDLGYSGIRLYMYRGSQHVVTRVLEQGLSSLDQALADALNIDVHLAHTYLLTNHENCQEGSVCTASFNGIAVELMRALNFYRFSNPDSNLAGMWLCGGGANIPALKNVIEQTLDITVYPVDTLIPGDELPEGADLAQAIGIALS